MNRTSQTAPPSDLPNLEPSLLSSNGKVRPKPPSAPSNRRRMRSVPAVMLPHWSEPPICTLTCEPPQPSRHQLSRFPACPWRTRAPSCVVHSATKAVDALEIQERCRVRPAKASQKLRVSHSWMTDAFFHSEPQFRRGTHRALVCVFNNKPRSHPALVPSEGEIRSARHAHGALFAERAAHLMLAVQMNKVVTLQQLVGELREGHAVAIKPCTHRVLRSIHPHARVSHAPRIESSPTLAGGGAAGCDGSIS